jgi:hypothetical protein
MSLLTNQTKPASLPTAGLVGFDAIQNLPGLQDL